jgi:hypothetical protein
MKRIVRLILPLFLALIVVGTVYAIVIKDRPTASPSNGNVIVSWTTVSESSVLRFDVMRAQVLQGVPQDFHVAGSVEPQGAGKPYEFVDHDVFKNAGGLFAYKVRVVFQDQSFSDSDIATTMLVSNTYRRTWGSIKAMFR